MRWNKQQGGILEQRERGRGNTNMILPWIGMLVVQKCEHHRSCEHTSREAHYVDIHISDTRKVRIAQNGILQCDNISMETIGAGHNRHAPCAAVANLGNTKWCKKPEKVLKPWYICMGTYLIVLDESFHMNIHMTWLGYFSFFCILVHWTKVTSASEGIGGLERPNNSKSLVPSIRGNLI